MLGVRVETLYAYVSRGLIRSEAAQGSSRARRYRREDIEALQRRKALRHNPKKAAETALHFGAPVLASAITLIENGRFYYRGHDVLTLAESHPFEAVASLIWRDTFSWRDLFSQSDQFAGTPSVGSPTLAAFQTALPVAVAQDWAAYDLSPKAVAQTGARILLRLTAVATGQAQAGTVAARLQQAWAPQQPEAEPLLNAALVLCADHELNVSSFTARCVASAAGTPYGVVQAGLAALQGAKHGGHTERVAALFQEAEAVGAETAVHSRLRRGEGMLGFGHPLYPDGDPRGRFLLQQVADATLAPGLAAELATAVYHSIGARPTVDFGLVAVARALKLPGYAPLLLFALGRTAGWIGHALEQYQLDQIIRPRARYVGPPAKAHAG